MLDKGSVSKGTVHCSRVDDLVLPVSMDYFSCDHRELCPFFFLLGLLFTMITATCLQKQAPIHTGEGHGLGRAEGLVVQLSTAKRRSLW